MIKDLIYGKNNLFAVTDEAVNTYIFRPLGWPIAKFLEKTPITPNQVTFIGLIFGILSGVFYLPRRALKLSFWCTSPFYRYSIRLYRWPSGKIKKYAVRIW